MKILTKYSYASTYTKVITLLSLVSLCLLLLVLVLYYYMYSQEKAIFKSSNELYKNEINSLLKLNSESYISLTTDVTYWDEFVDFTKTKNIKWFNTSVANLIDTYNAEYLCAYNDKGEFLTKVSTLKIKTKEFIPKEALKKLYTKKIDKFYLKIPEGVVEVYGATIHPSDDPFKNKTKPQGYFFLVRLLDNEYFANIEKICSSNIKFYEGNETVKKTVYNIVPLKDYKGKSISNLFFKRSYNIDFWITKTILMVMAIAIVLSWIIYYLFAIKWSKLPLNLIKKILRDNDNSSAINSLKNIKGEFRYIGKLFEENKAKTEELKEAKEKAEESDKLKTSFLMNLSHEIRTPMNAIVGFSDLLLNTENSKKDNTEYVKIIQNSGKNLLAIIDDLVEMSKLDSNLIKPNFSSISIEKLVQSTFESVKITNKNHDVDFKIVKSKFEPKNNILTDVVKLNQIITNLLNNALKFTKEGFVVLSYSIDENNNLLVFEVKDSGIGIPDDFQNKIFKRFNKISNSAISANEGLGLGLAISKAYIDLLGGNIAVQSQLGIGSTFTFSIPFQYDPVEKKSEDILLNEIKYDLGKDEIILVAEDDNINYMLIEKILKMFNFKIIRAKDGFEAVEICKSNDEIDLVFMDIKMPNLDGYQAFEKIREFNKLVPIVAQTSYSFPEEIDKIKKIGFDDFVTKPLDKERIYEIVKKYFQL